MTSIMSETFAETTLTKFKKVTNKPEKFLSAPEKLLDNIKGLIKDVYDYTKQQESFKTTETLKELVVNDFDVEQIWQQIELQNNAILTKSLISVSRLVAAKDRLWFVNLNEQNAEEESDNNEDNNENVEDEEDIENSDKEDIESETNQEDIELNESDLEDEEIKKDSNQNKSYKPSIVDDKFFKLNEMEEFLLKEEKDSHKKKDSDDDDEESVDLFDAKEEDLEEDLEGEEEEDESQNNPKYKDFFGEENQEVNNKRKREDDKEEEDSEQQLDLNLKSNLELREERLKKKIKEIEEIALEEKPWHMKGEISADKRPQNSLLEEIVEFDLITRPAPVITEETTLRLEDVIRQRIKDKVWDDVVRKQKIVDAPAEYKKKLMLDQEKSKKSLAHIYEEEYLKQKEALDPDAADKPEEEPKEHIEIKSMMKSLFSKLDALSNFHFTPKVVAPELRIVNNMPAISMEEVAPVATSDAALLAPEEIKKKHKGDIIGKGERTKTDKKRQRRQKKTKQKEHAIQKQKKEIEKMRPGLGNKYSKEKTAKLIERVTKDRNVDKMDESTGAKSVKSSSAFFTQLQEEVKGAIKSKTAIQKKKNKEALTGKKLKM